MGNSDTLIVKLLGNCEHFMLVVGTTTHEIPDSHPYSSIKTCSVKCSISGEHK